MTYSFLVLETHLDFLGHVNNATYLQLFEEARWAWITEKGFGYDKIIQTQLSPVILEVNLKFLSEVRLREKATIESSLLEYTNKVGKLKQSMKKADGTVACEAVLTFGLFSLETRKLVLPTPEWMAALQ
ncbi:MAG: acyl-CoA thioesterase [Pseudobdellovibrionaceae bacterium]|jgi:acyl-CoA thioester hydrolase